MRGFLIRNLHLSGPSRKSSLRYNAREARREIMTHILRSRHGGAETKLNLPGALACHNIFTAPQEAAYYSFG